MTRAAIRGPLNSQARSRSSAGRPAASALVTPAARATGSGGATVQPGKPDSVSGTSPTATDTTGVEPASASLTASGEPSDADVTSITSTAVLTSTTSSREEP